jgi:hypothetical protein
MAKFLSVIALSAVAAAAPSSIPSSYQQGQGTALLGVDGLKLNVVGFLKNVEQKAAALNKVASDLGKLIRVKDLERRRDLLPQLQVAQKGEQLTNKQKEKLKRLKKELQLVGHYHFLDAIAAKIVMSGVSGAVSRVANAGQAVAAAARENKRRMQLARTNKSSREHSAPKKNFLKMLWLLS